MMKLDSQVDDKDQKDKSDGDDKDHQDNGDGDYGTFQSSGGAVTGGQNTRNST